MWPLPVVKFFNYENKVHENIVQYPDDEITYEKVLDWLKRMIDEKSKNKIVYLN